MDALISLQLAVDSDGVQLRHCDLHDELRLVVDSPNGTPRFTYAIMKDGKVHAIASFVQADPIDGTPCFNIGYAVAEAVRRRGLGVRVLELAIEEFANGMSRTPIRGIYLEAVVSVQNVPSNKIARQVMFSEPKEDVDCFSGEPVNQYLRKLDLHVSVA
jgi:hypothetical protein